MSGEKIYVDEEEPLIDVADFAFEPHDVSIRRDKWVTDEFEIYEMLGKGKFGEVKRCREISTGREFAAKFIGTSTPQDEDDVRHEVNIMKALHHKRLLQLYDAFHTKNMMCLVLEVILGGELFDRVICEDFVLTEKACVCFMRQICEGVEYIHSQNIIHLDMKPENILCLTRTGNRVKIIDFGLARVYDPKKDLRVLFGTPEFMAPEVVNYEAISFATDMWSVGVICYVLLSGLSPFMGDEDSDTLTNVIKGEYDFNYKEFDEVSEAAKDMIEKLLIIDKKKRLTATECLAHPWLKGEGIVCWSKIEGWFVDIEEILERDGPPSSPNLDLTKERLKQYVYKRRWQKGFHAIVALKRMGMDLETIITDQPQNSSKKPEIAPKPINGKRLDPMPTSKPDTAPKPKWKQALTDDKAAKKNKAPVKREEENGIAGKPVKDEPTSSTSETSQVEENNVGAKKAPEISDSKTNEAKAKATDGKNGGTEEDSNAVCGFGNPSKRRGFDINKHRDKVASKVQSFGLVFGGTVKRNKEDTPNKITSQSNSNKENGPVGTSHSEKLYREDVKVPTWGGNRSNKPPVAPKPNSSYHHHPARRWQKGNDRYIVMNRVQDHVKFFTVDDPRELNHLSDDDISKTKQKFLPLRSS